MPHRPPFLTRAFWKPRWPRLAVAGALIAVPLGAWLTAREGVKHERIAFLVSDSAEIRHTLNARLEGAATTMRAARGFLEADPSITRDAWRRFASRAGLDRACPGASGLMFVRAIDEPQLEDFLFETREDGAPDFDVAPIGDPDPDETSHALVQFDSAVEQSTLGLDLWTDPQLRRALEQAIEADSVVMTAPLAPDANVLLFMPVSNRGADGLDHPLLGWVSCRIDPRALAGSLTGDKRWGGRGLSVADIEAGVLFDRPAEGDAHGAAAHEFSIDFAGRRWDATVSEPGLFAGVGVAPVPIIAACAGAVLSATPLVVLFWTRRVRTRAEAFVEESTRALRESEHNARAALDGIALRVAVLDESGKVLDVNPAWRECVASGRHVPGVVAQGQNYVAVCDAFVGPSSIDAAYCANAVRDALKGGTEGRDAQVDVRDESEHRAYAVRVRRCQGEPPRIVVSHADLAVPSGNDATRTSAGGEETPHNNGRLASAALASGDGFWDWDLAAGTAWFSERCCEMLGREPGALDGGLDDWTEVVHPDDADRVMECLRAHLTERSPFDAEFRAHHAAGSWVTLRARGRAQWNDGVPTRIAGTFIEPADLPVFEPGDAIRRAPDLAAEPEPLPESTEPNEEPEPAETAEPADDSAPAEPLPIVAPEVNEPTPGTSGETDTPFLAETHHPAPSPGNHALVAVDGPGNRKLIALYLRKAGLEVETADSARAALDLFDAADAEGCPFALVLVDMQMPEIDGFAAARAIRERGAEVRVIGLTIHARDNDRQRCLDAGCDEVVPKPIKKPVLLETVARLLGRCDPETRAA